MASFTSRAFGPAFAGASLLMIAAVSPASAQLSFDPVDEVLGTLGITGRPRPHIEYRERPPLVVPPSGAGLRQPEDRAAVRGGRWPNDPDRAARRRQEEEARAPSEFAAGDESGTGLITRGATGRNRYAGVPTTGNSSGGEINPARILNREQVQRIHAQTGEATPPSGMDPGRRTLTDPPRGYRAAQGGRPVKATVEPMQNSDRIQIDVNNPNR